MDYTTKEWCLKFPYLWPWSSEDSASLVGHLGCGRVVAPDGPRVEADVESDWQEDIDGFPNIGKNNSKLTRNTNFIPIGPQTFLDISKKLKAKIPQAKKLIFPRKLKQTSSKIQVFAD